MSQEPKKDWCGLKDDPTFAQCCCACAFHLPVHYHCGTSPKPTDDEKAAAGVTGKCVCGVRKGWACVPPGAGVVHDNWPEHYIGCELYTPKHKCDP